MISVEFCKKYLNKFNLTDEQIEQIRNILYSVSENIIYKYIEDAKRQSN